MPSKTIPMPGLGDVMLIKRRSARSIRITLSASTVRVSLPYWLPYQAGVEFVKSKQAWITANQKPAHFFTAGQAIGKSHHLLLKPTDESTIKTRVMSTAIRISYPYDMPIEDTKLQAAIQKGALRALKAQADILLPQRLATLAGSHGFHYGSVSSRRLKSRWGSCNNQQDIVLNIFLMQLPWELIDYVLLHELTHTEHLNHSPEFWQRLEQCMPGAKAVRKRLHQFQPHF